MKIPNLLWHQTWGSSISNEFGDIILDFVNEQNLCILNSGSPTRRTGPDQIVSAPDISISSPSLVPSLSL